MAACRTPAIEAVPHQPQSFRHADGWLLIVLASVFELHGAGCGMDGLPGWAPAQEGERPGPVTACRETTESVHGAGPRRLKQHARYCARYSGARQLAVGLTALWLAVRVDTEAQLGK